MHIRYETIVRGATLADITDAATMTWREFVNDPGADLPWNAELIIEEEPPEVSVDGSTILRRGYRAQVRVTTDSQSTPVVSPPSTA